MERDVKRDILEKIRAYDRIVLSRHALPDGDAVGATKGLQGIIRATFPNKQVLVVNEDYAAAMAFLGPEDAQPDEAFYRDALVIVLDVGSENRISNRCYALGRELVVIDHHIETQPYGDLAWVEPDRSSTCEMIVSFYAAFADELRLDREAATCLDTGMVTDSGRFRFDSVSGETLRLAALLLDRGVDTETLFSHLYLCDSKTLKFHAYALRRMKITQHGVAHLFISRRIRQALHLTCEQAYTAVYYLNSLRGSIVWIAFIENDDGSIRVRLRSRFITINELAEKYGGGGHACASGATETGRKQMHALLRDADRLIAAYKETHTGWQ